MKLFELLSITRLVDWLIDLQVDLLGVRRSHRTNKNFRRSILTLFLQKQSKQWWSWCNNAAGPFEPSGWSLVSKQLGHAGKSPPESILFKISSFDVLHYEITAASDLPLSRIYQRQSVLIWLLWLLSLIKELERFFPPRFDVNAGNFRDFWSSIGTRNKTIDKRRKGLGRMERILPDDSAAKLTTMWLRQTAVLHEFSDEMEIVSNLPRPPLSRILFSN